MFMSNLTEDRTVSKLLRQQAALAAFGSFAFREPNLIKVLTEAARICAQSLDVPFSKVCRYRPEQNDLLIEAGWGWRAGVVGCVVSQADESSPQGRAYTSGKPVIIRNINTANDLVLPAFYEDHRIVSTVDVLIPAIEGAAFGVLEIDSTLQHQYDEHDINFLTGFANVLAEAVATAARMKSLRKALADKDLMAEELQHRVRNNLQTVGSMLESYARTTTGQARDGIDSIVRRVTTLGQVYDSLLGVGLSETVDLGHYLVTLCTTLPGLQVERASPVTVECRAERVMLELDHVATLGMVVSELVANSYEHAFAGRPGTVTVTLAKCGPGSAKLTIADDGYGMVYDPLLLSTGHGMGLVMRLVERTGSTIIMNHNAGTAWEITVPTVPRQQLAAD